jgi:hypothetical protein
MTGHALNGAAAWSLDVTFIGCGEALRPLNRFTLQWWNIAQFRGVRLAPHPGLRHMASGGQAGPLPMLNGVQLDLAWGEGERLAPGSSARCLSLFRRLLVHALDCAGV